MHFDSTLDAIHPSTFTASPTTRPAKDRLADNMPTTQTTRILLLLANRFDCEMIAGQFRESRSIEVVGAVDHFSTGIEQINLLKPQIVVYDPGMHSEGLFVLKEMLLNECLGNLVILDDRIREGAVIKAIRLPRTSYLTRQTSVAEFRRTIESIGESSKQVFDAEIEGRVVLSPKGNTLAPQADKPALTLLTQREFEVLEHVAAGWSVRECAAQLHVAVSTIDNHKSKIMKKLDIRKASRLIHLAIREGVIQV